MFPFNTKIVGSFCFSVLVPLGIAILQDRIVAAMFS